MWLSASPWLDPYLSDPALRRRVTAATNKTESFNGFSQWIGFGNRGVIADNDPVEQEKAMKFNALLTNDLLTELVAEFPQVSDLVAEASLSRPWRHRETWQPCLSLWSGNWWPWMIRGIPTGSSTPPGSRLKERAHSCGTCKEPVARRRLPVPTG
ncbi:Tn3 family transposase [Streptomyces sp. NPDC060035]|uniref:Tn3 family transposase n=1 Tax=Streptomyces sp. NPDC060035 TaxID=3347044 RepID=UPI00367951C7